MSTTALPGELREDENFTTALYRAAIGPVSTDYYLTLFTDWEASGQWRPRWNTAAALWTLGWLVFRRMGGIALAYAGALVGSLLLIFGIGGLLLSWSVTVQWVAFALWLLAAVAVPGLLGNHWFHQHCRKRMDAALAAQSDVAQACADLAGQSSPRKRALMVGGVQVGLMLALGLAAMQFSALLQGPGFPSEQATASPQTASGTVKELGDALPLTAAPTSAPAARVASQPASNASPPASIPSELAKSAGQVATVVKPVVAIDKPAATAPAIAVAKKAVPASLNVAQSAPANTASVASEKISTSGRYGVNVGLFAKTENAQSVRSKLESANLPVLTETLNMPRGPRIRVRVGPFATQAEATSAATRIRTLGLDALTYRE